MSHQVRQWHINFVEHLHDIETFLVLRKSVWQFSFFYIYQTITTFVLSQSFWYVFHKRFASGNDSEIGLKNDLSSFMGIFSGSELWIEHIMFWICAVSSILKIFFISQIIKSAISLNELPSLDKILWLQFCDFRLSQSEGSPWIIPLLVP